MKPTTPDDDDLRQRLRELGRHESAGAPSLDRVLRGRRPAPSLVVRWRVPAAALAGLLGVLAAVWWRPQPERAAVVGQVEPSPGDPAGDWSLPTDGLLADVAATSEVEQLSREIEGLLRP